MTEVPEHVAIILDGNGRWAKAKGMPRSYGHAAGAKNVEPILRAANAIGIRYVTMYAFSTENWSRPSDEVKALMKLLDQYLSNCLKLAADNNMRVRVIGDISVFEPKFQEKIRVLEDASKDYTGLTFLIALNYGGRDEMIRAMRKMTSDLVKDHEAAFSDEELQREITEERFSSYLDTADVPDPDLLIRTSGEMRLSNYLLWQMAYTEFYFTPVPWPDFHEEDLRKAVYEYQNRDRRYGKI